MPDELDNTLKLGTFEMTAHWDRVIILQDEFRSGYECARCKGEGWLVCENCEGTGKSIVVKDGRCTMCAGEKRILCPDCKGKGGLLAVPDSAKHIPTTGKILSVGDKVTKLALGDDVIFPSYCGYSYDLTFVDAQGKEIEAVVTILREEEVLCKIKGHLELRRVRRAAAVSTAA